MRKPNLQTMPRRRLIDTLVEQTKFEEDSEEDEAPDSQPSEVESVKDDPAKLSHDQFAEILSQALGQDSLSQPLPSSQTSQGVGPRVTYSRQRSMLAESDLLDQLSVDMPFQAASQSGKPRRGAIPATTLSSFQEDEEMLDLAPAVTSVHELRQAGANQRFLEEIEDLLDTIGKPVSPLSSMRRTGLSELSSRLKDKNFLRQFRDNGIEQRFFLHLGQEQDVVAGFYIITVLTLVLADASMPHLVTHIRRNGISRLLVRLIGAKDPISKTAKDRKSNMSKMALGLLSEHQKYFLTLPLWGDLKPLLLSPRTVALKCLELMVRQTREAGKADDIFSKEMTSILFDILKTVSDLNSVESLQSQGAVDFHLALSVLELHSIKAMTARDESIWISDYLPVVVNTVEILLVQTASEFATLRYMLLRLVVNVTNNDPKASEVFAKKEVLGILGQAIIAKFNKISEDLDEDELCEALGQLVVALGVMINLAESSTVRECFNGLCDEPHDPLVPMVQLFMDNEARMLEANTQEESQRNVAFGYLSILLGYLALSPTISERIRVRQKGLTLQPLLTSIEQFISYHKAVDDILEAEEDGYSRQTGLTDRLEALVERLRR
ncbi:rheb small monomeric gtpase [Phlyctema vagabunda]|uniref:Rheb small monomeric gtpase n=1 Tax=Phlyctema vagabunda TaxID=108571 RepID=A0ABR4PQJ6_9HELO